MPGDRREVMHGRALDDVCTGQSLTSSVKRVPAFACFAYKNQ